jgi:Recombination endonuclease VII
MTYSQKLRLLKCSKCLKLLPRSKFWSQTGGKPEGQCKQCYSKSCKLWRSRNPAKVKSYSQKWHSLNPDRAHKHKLRYRYGISVQEFSAIPERQGGVCAICKEAETKHQNLSVDHCHATGVNRGLLCDRCNRSLGGFRDSIQILKSAVCYLEGVIL